MHPTVTKAGARPVGPRVRSTAAAAIGLGMAGREREHPGRLSGGERQRVAIARALAAHGGPWPVADLPFQAGAQIMPRATPAPGGAGPAWRRKRKGGGRLALEYRSTRGWRGLPLVHVAFGAPPGGRYRPARGVIAVGNVAVGVVAVGPVAVGVVALGPAAVGVAAVGVASVGLVAAGVAALGVVAAGVVAVGIRAAGIVAAAMSAR